jgi:hypothetical protein
MGNDETKQEERRTVLPHFPYVNRAEIRRILNADASEETLYVTVPAGLGVKRACRVCGCTENHACPGGCYWVDVDLCSACREKGLS